ncbi:hypothetical protein GCK32_012725 [Trichostrongylus colubriformis]|uniref:Uncharacterized protein n=1 Tax=Trichostrongylus colubriformis TaxID=6319 RepID=A0AAN8FW99_TRICO
MFEAVSFTKVLIPFLPALGSIFSILLTVPALQLVETMSRRLLLLRTLSLCLVADCLLLVFSLLSMGVAVGFNWIFSMLTTLVYYPLNETIGGWSYLLFIIPTSLVLLVLYFFLPETRFPYLTDPMENRFLVDLGPPNPYGTFPDEDGDLF